MSNKDIKNVKETLNKFEKDVKNKFDLHKKSCVSCNNIIDNNNCKNENTIYICSLKSKFITIFDIIKNINLELDSLNSNLNNTFNLTETNITQLNEILLLLEVYENNIIPLHIGLLCLERDYITGVNDVIDMVNNDVSNNRLTYDKYVVDGLLINTTTAIDDFLSKYPATDNFAIICSTSQVTIQADTYIKNNKGGIYPVFSPNASAISCRNLNNGLTLGYLDQYTTMSYFMVVKNYFMEKLLILYKQTPFNNIFISDWILVLKKQADLLGIPYEVVNIDDIIITPPVITDKTAIFIVTDNSADIYPDITAGFLASIPKGSFIGLPDTAGDCKDVFGDVPTFVFTPTPTSYTATSLSVYVRTTDKINFNYIIYPMYDLIYTFAKMSITPNIKLTIEKYQSFVAFIGINQAWNMTSDLDLNNKSFNYGNYQCMFTKDVYVGPYKNIYLETYLGGTSNLPESYSIFRECGIVPNTSSSVNYLLVPIQLLYDQNDNLILVSNYNDFTKPLKNGEFVSQGGSVVFRFIYSYDPDSGYFDRLDYILLNTNNPEILFFQT